MMTAEEYIELTARAAAGEVLPVVDQFLLEMERARRNAKPNVLEQLAARSRRNPLTGQSDTA